MCKQRLYLIHDLIHKKKKKKCTRGVANVYDPYFELKFFWKPLSRILDALCLWIRGMRYGLGQPEEVARCIDKTCWLVQVPFWQTTNLSGLFRLNWIQLQQEEICKWSSWIDLHEVTPKVYWNFFWTIELIEQIVAPGGGSDQSLQSMCLSWIGLFNLTRWLPILGW